MNAYSQFEGTWANLRVGVLIKGEKSEFRYGDWLRKPAGSSAELKAQISRQKNWTGSSRLGVKSWQFENDAFRYC